MLRPVALILLSLAVAVPVPVQAITVVPMTFEELVAGARAVVYARVAEVRGRWTADRRNIESVVMLEALRYLKGDLGEQVVMRIPGGEAGGLIHVLPGAPVLREGDLVILFLGASGPAMPTLVGFTQGVFRVTIDSRGGVALVTPLPLKASAIGGIVRGDAGRRALTLDAFAAEVNAVVRSGEALAAAKRGEGRSLARGASGPLLTGRSRDRGHQ